MSTAPHDLANNQDSCPTANTTADNNSSGNGQQPHDERKARREKRIHFVLCLYGLYNLISGAFVLGIAAFLGFILATDGKHVLISSNDVTLITVLSVFQIVLLIVNAAMAVGLGMALIRNKRRHAAQAAYALIALNIASLVVDIMLHGVVNNVLASMVHFAILIIIATTIDPTLISERRLQRHLREMETEQEAEEGTLGRAKGDRGFIELDFFNLFWVFVVCCFLGLVIETIYHFVIVDPGHYQDRAGLLFGPFSPIYGFGAVLMTVALNRFYKANPIIIFLVSAVIGGMFEAAVSWFMQVGFGAVAWSYSGAKVFGLFPDPIAQLTGGRTCINFMCMWGALGFVWIKACLPWLLRLINKIPWKLRYSFTTFCAILMIIDGVMTLQALECWYDRESGIQPNSPIEEFYADHFDNEYMAHRFQSMTITPSDSARVPSQKA